MGGNENLLFEAGFLFSKKYNMIFTSESVSPGHPDKICDQISDAILDGILTKDKTARVAVETLVKDNKVVLAGEIKTDVEVDFEAITRAVIDEIGYNDDKYGFNSNTCEIQNLIGCQSPDIARGVDARVNKAQGAGDQGLMFGFACDETAELMPAPIMLAHQLVRKQADLRKKKILSWLRPDAKSQVSCRYENGSIVGIESVVFSTQHDEDITQNMLEDAVIEEIIKPTLPNAWISAQTKFYINPTGKFVIGGPMGDAGLTGRKIIVDTYGGMARHGGGAFSGKDPSKVDRSATYAARYVAKNIVAAGLAKKCEIQLAYAIGVAEPISISINTFTNAYLDDEIMVNLIRKYFHLSPEGIINMLDLARPIYKQTACYGHFGRSEPDISWERVDKAHLLKNTLKESKLC